MLEYFEEEKTEDIGEDGLVNILKNSGLNFWLIVKIKIKFLNEIKL